MKRVVLSSCAVAAIALATATPVTAQERLNESGSLSEGDEQIASGEYIDEYSFRAEAGQTVDIHAQSTEFDTYLIVTGPGGVRFENDDYSDTNARIVETVPQSGTYQVLVTSFAPGETGRYRLTAGPGDPAMAGMSQGGGGAPMPDVSGADAQPLVAGRAVNGTLTSSDAMMADDKLYDLYELTAAPGTRLVLQMRSSSVDTFLMVSDGASFSDMNDDHDQAGGTNSRLEFTMPASGRVNVVATSYAPGERGAYTLAATDWREGGDDGPRQLGVGESARGTLSEADPRAAGGSAEDSWTLRLDAPERVRIAATSAEFDTTLRLETADGTILAENDDEPGAMTLNSLIDTGTLPAGDYRVVVSSYASDGLGAYDLQTSVRIGTPESEVEPASFAIGQRITGNLATGDYRLDSGEYFDAFEFTGQRGDRITIDMESGDFDTYLSLVYPGGGDEFNDDRSESEGTDSRLSMILPQDGTYRLRATSFDPGESGSYTLALTTDGSPARPLAEADRGPRIFALNIGVGAYERTSPLPLTDSDAMRITGSLLNTNRLAPESVTLVNAEATLENVQSAIASIERSIGPDDLFVLFYSGHGDKVASDQEIDGTAETLEFFDVAVHDYELDAMLDGISANTLIVLDSCFSGGFDNLVGDRQGRMAIFSSDGDLLSLVAGKYNSGGYIAYLLGEALNGAADANGNEVITAGELADYMRQGFYRITADDPLETEVHDGFGNISVGYQHIVIDRGGDGMPYEQELFRFGEVRQVARSRK